MTQLYLDSDWTYDISQTKITVRVASSPTLSTSPQTYQINLPPIGCTTVEMFISKAQPNVTIASVPSCSCTSAVATYVAASPPVDTGDCWFLKYTTTVTAPKVTILQFLTNPARVDLYSDNNYGGGMISVPRDTPNIGYNYSGWNDRASSMWVPPYTKVSLHEHDNYGGSFLPINNYTSQWVPYADLGAVGWNDRTTSVKVTYATP